MLNGVMTVFSILGGLALFIFGMHLMSDGLRGFAGANLRKILFRSTRNRRNGLGLGTLTGFLVQSSAATVLVVGFINAGLMTLHQSVPVMLGANIGTTLSMQLISFKLADYSLIAIALGFLMRSALPRPKGKTAGTALLGFGLLFLGMSTMSETLATHRDAFIPLLEQIDGATPRGLFTGILLAAVVTGIIQSSGAVIGMAFALIDAGVITDLSGAFPILIGANIGTCVTALLGSIGTHIDARRSALSHLLFNLFSTLLAALAAPLFYRWIPALGGNLVHQAANANTLKMVFTALIVLPFAPLHAALVRRLMPSRKKPPQSSFLDESLIPTPEQALYAVLRELRRMTELCRESLALDEQLLHTRNPRAVRTIEQHEKTIDAVKLALRDYLAKISTRVLSRRQAVLAQHLDRCMTEIERIGDHLKVLCQLNEKIAPYTQHTFFDPCQTQLEELYLLIHRILDNLIASLSPEYEHFEERAATILSTRKEFIEKKDAARALITNQIGRDKLPPLLGIYLNEYLMTFSKIVRHCKAIAGTQKKPFFWLKRHNLNRPAKPCTEKERMEELDESNLFDTL